LSSDLKNSNPKEELYPYTIEELVSLSERETVIIAFTADWLGASEILDVVFEKLSALEHAEHTFIHLDVDKNKKITHFFRVTEIPTIVVLSQGEIKDRFSNIYSKKKILQRLGLPI